MKNFKYLKMFENFNYGEFHFGTPVFDFFPWYESFPKEISELPKLNTEMYGFIKDSLDGDILKRFYFLFYNDHGKISLLINQGDMVTRSKKLSIDSLEGELHYNDNVYSVDSWNDIIKIRLMITLGRKKETDNYLSILDDIIDIWETVLYSEDISDIRVSDLKLENIHTVIQRFNSSIDFSNFSDDDVINFIKNYDSSDSKGYKDHNFDRFVNGVKQYSQSGKEITEKQIDAIRKIGTYHISLNTIDKSTPCIILNEKQKEIIYPRLKSLGFKSLTIGRNEKYIIYK